MDYCLEWIWQKWPKSPSFCLKVLVRPKFSPSLANRLDSRPHLISRERQNRRKQPFLACLLPWPEFWQGFMYLSLLWVGQVTGFLAGERNYAELHGDTGPLVYPAGFLYVYSGIRYITRGAVFPAQVLHCSFQIQTGAQWLTNIILVEFSHVPGCNLVSPE